VYHWLALLLPSLR